MPEINIKVKVEIDRLDDILSSFAELTSILSAMNAGVSTPAVEAAGEAPAPKKPRKAKAKIEETPAPVAEEEPTFETTKADPVEEEQVVTKEMVQHACIDAAKRVGKDKTIAAIKSLGYSGLSQVPEEKFKALFETLNGLK